MIKRELLVSCDRNLIHIDNCIKCVFYLGMKDNQINCSKDSSVMQNITHFKEDFIKTYHHIIKNGEKVDIKI